MLEGNVSEDFVAKISQALEGAGRRGIHVIAGAGSCDLESQQFARHPAEDEEGQMPPGRPHHLEEPPGPRDLGATTGPRGSATSSTGCRARARSDA